MEPAQGVIEHLREGAGKLFVWGRCDCGLFMADWVIKRRGVDPAASLRGRYATALGAARHVRRLGGFEEMGRALMKAAGLSTTDSPLEGDVALIDHPVVGPAFAIYTGLGWAVKGPTGLAMGHYPVIVAWKI